MYSTVEQLKIFEVLPSQLVHLKRGSSNVCILQALVDWVSKYLLFTTMK